MGIFKKRAKDDTAEDLATLDAPEAEATLDQSESDAADTSADPADAAVAVGDDIAGDGADDDVNVADEAADDAAAVAALPVDRSAGPFDASEVDEDEQRVDFGSLQFVVRPDLQLQVDADEESQRYTGITAIADGSACQVQVFAAPKTRGVWREIRGEIADNLIAGGGSADIVTGPYGPELHAKMLSQGPDGRTVLAPARFIGIDGPRWFLRVVISGNAAIDDDAATPLLEFARSMVVVRGGEPRAPRELLELTLPEALTQAPAEEHDHPTELNPFERGPEITEVR